MKTFQVIAYDCPDKTLINEIFNVEAADLREARRIAYDAVPHAVAFDVYEADEEEECL